MFGARLRKTALTFWVTFLGHFLGLVFWVSCLYVQLTLDLPTNEILVQDTLPTPTCGFGLESQPAVLSEPAHSAENCFPFFGYQTAIPKGSRTRPPLFLFFGITSLFFSENRITFFLSASETKITFFFLVGTKKGSRTRTHFLRHDVHNKFLVL